MRASALAGDLGDLVAPAWNTVQVSLVAAVVSVVVVLPVAWLTVRYRSRLADVATKAEDIVITPDGRYISPSVLTHPFKPFHQLLK